MCCYYILTVTFIKNVSSRMAVFDNEAAETFCIVCLPPEKTYFLKKIFG